MKFFGKTAALVLALAMASCAALAEDAQPEAAEQPAVQAEETVQTAEDQDFTLKQAIARAEAAFPGYTFKLKKMTARRGVGYYKLKGKDGTDDMTVYVSYRAVLTKEEYKALKKDKDSDDEDENEEDSEGNDRNNMPPAPGMMMGMPGMNGACPNGMMPGPDGKQDGDNEDDDRDDQNGMKPGMPGMNGMMPGPDGRHGDDDRDGRNGPMPEMPGMQNGCSCPCCQNGQNGMKPGDPKDGPKHQPQDGPDHPDGQPGEHPQEGPEHPEDQPEENPDQPQDCPDMPEDHLEENPEDMPDQMEEVSDETEAGENIYTVVIMDADGNQKTLTVSAASVTVIPGELMVKDD